MKMDQRTKVIRKSSARAATVLLSVRDDVTVIALLHSSVSHRQMLPPPYLTGISWQPRVSVSVISFAMARLKQPRWTSIEEGSPEIDDHEISCMALKTLGGNIRPIKHSIKGPRSLRSQAYNCGVCQLNRRGTTVFAPLVSWTILGRKNICMLNTYG